MVNADGDGADRFIRHRQNRVLGEMDSVRRMVPGLRDPALYRRDRGRWEGGLFAKVAVHGKVGLLTHSYLHYPYRDISEQIRGPTGILRRPRRRCSRRDSGAASLISSSVRSSGS